MPKIVPFRGVLYNREKVGDLGDVITPPYDVISEPEREEYYRRHPQNMIRLILSKGDPRDTEYNNRYTRAAKYFNSWLAQGILIQDTKPALYLTEVHYKSKDITRTRLGFVGLVQLEDFERGGILPHEKTFSATKADRLRLMEACKANFSPVFSLFSDRDGEVFRLIRAYADRVEPDLEFKELAGYHHRLWRVTDQRVHKEIEEEVLDRPVYIADGHHRYETALNYRNLVMSKQGTFDPEASYNFIMMSLSSMNDPGLTIGPVHRLLSNLPENVVESFAEKAEAHFDVETFKFENVSRTEVQAAFLARIRAGAKNGVMGASLQGYRTFYILRPKEGIMDQLFGEEIPKPLRKLNVTIATKLVFQKILGMDDAALDDERRILYVSRSKDALEAVDAGRCQLALILNPTRLTDVEKVSKAGLTMPRKSTYFYPKVVSGLVINKLGDW